jgi:hypothetical protein
MDNVTQYWGKPTKKPVTEANNAVINMVISVQAG